MTLNEQAARNCIRSSIMCAAMGDALGYGMGGVEFDSTISPLNKKVFGPKGTLNFSDDTQMAWSTATGLLIALNMGRAESDWRGIGTIVARNLIEWAKRPLGGSHRAPGGTCMAGTRRLAHLHNEGRLAEWPLPEERNEKDQKGCGIVMRSAPFGYLFPNSEFGLGGYLAQQTHDGTCARAQADFMHAFIGELVMASGQGDDLDPFDVAKTVLDRMTRAGADSVTMAMLWEAMYLADNRPSKDAAPYDAKVFDKWRGWRGDEAAAAGLYAFLAFPYDPKPAMLLAANTPGDSDSIATVTGALVGAFSLDFPEDWAEHLEERDALEDLVDDIMMSLADRGLVGVASEVAPTNSTLNPTTNEVAGE